MRHVALDLGSKKTTYCEVSQGEVVQRGAVAQVETLSTVLGPEQPEATVAIEACREADAQLGRLFEALRLRGRGGAVSTDSSSDLPNSA